MGLQSLKRKLFTRCAGCGGWSTKANPVNSRGSGRAVAPQRPWDSEVGLFHGPCLAEASRANRRLYTQHSAEPHWAVYTCASHLVRMVDQGTLDNSEVADKLRQVAEHERAEFRKIIKQGEE